MVRILRTGCSSETKMVTAKIKGGRGRPGYCGRRNFFNVSTKKNYLWKKRDYKNLLSLIPAALEGGERER